MDLQNIVLDFTNTKVYSYYTDKTFDIPSVSNMATLQTELDTEAGFTVASAVIQYTEDQYGKGAVPRVIVTDGAEENEQRAILPISGLATATTDSITVARGEIETEITEQTA